jgi:hypothetical protein
MSPSEQPIPSPFSKDFTPDDITTKNTTIINGLKIRKVIRDYIVEVPLPSAALHVIFTEIIRSRQSFETVITVQLIHQKEGVMSPFSQRIDLNSASAISNLATALNAAYGNKKDGYNWVLILNRVAVAIKRAITEDKKPTAFSPDDQYETSTYLVQHFLEQGSPTLIHGDGSTGKSYLTLYMAVCAALERDFFGKHTQYFKTLYIDHEATAKKLKNRLHRIANGLGVPFSSLTPHIHWYKPEGSLANEQEIIARIVEEGGYQAIIIDAGASASGGSPMDEQAVLRMFSALDQIPAAKLIIHHEPKNLEGVGDDKAYYGTTFWRNAPRLAWRLKRESKDGPKSIIKATHHKANDDGESAPFVYAMTFTDDPLPATTFTVLDDFAPSEESQIVSLLAETGHATLAQISEGTGIPRTSLQRAIHNLMGNGTIIRQQDKAHSQRFYYRLPDEN